MGCYQVHPHRYNEVIDEKFPPKEFEVNLDIPSLQIQKEPMIREDTFFEDK